MINFREVNEDDILKEWFDCMEETYLCYVDEQDRANEFNYDPFREKILKNVPKQNKKYVEKQLDFLVGYRFPGRKPLVFKSSPCRWQ